MLPRPWCNEPDFLGQKPSKGDTVLAWNGLYWEPYTVTSAMTRTLTLERVDKGKVKRRSLVWTKCRKPFA